MWVVSKETDSGAMQLLLYERDVGRTVGVGFFV